MNRYGNFKKLSDKGKKNDSFFDDEFSPASKLKRDRRSKERRSYDNSLRSRNLDRLLSNEEE